MTREALKRANDIADSLKRLESIENVKRATGNHYFTFSGYYDDKGTPLDENISSFLMPVFESYIHKYRSDLEAELKAL